MAIYSYRKYKIVIAPDSKKRQGLHVGDIVRRHYYDHPRLIYSLMVVLEAGVDIIGDQESAYFIGALVEGDAPQSGELLDFVRVANLFDADRSGALYLTASDSDSPFIDVIDGLAVEKSLCYPMGISATPAVADKNNYACTGSDYFVQQYRDSEQGESRIFRLTRNSITAPSSGVLGFQQTLERCPEHPATLIVSYKIRASRPFENVGVRFGYSSGEKIDGAETISVTTDWQYRLMVVSIDYPAQYERSFFIDLSGLLSEGQWCEIADLNIIGLADIAAFGDSTKARIGKVKGVVDPVFGVIEGYGAYFQNLYATRNVNIAGTLTAGDENGFSSTFYVGKIHKNVILDSMGGTFADPRPALTDQKSPAGTGDVWQMGASSKIEIQSAVWRTSHVGQFYCFSIWLKTQQQTTVSIYQDEFHIRDIVLGGSDGWRRCHASFRIRESQAPGMTIRIDASLTGMLIASPQMEAGTTPSQYQPTDGTLSYVEDYGAWFSKGGIGGTIQNPLLRLNEDGTISSRDGSFVIQPDGTGHFAGGKFKWTRDDIELTDMTIRWGALDDEAKEHILSQSTPIHIQAFVSSNLSTTQIYISESRTWVPNWANTNLILTPSLFVSPYSSEDLISVVADPLSKRPGIKVGSVTWLKNGKPIEHGKGSCWIGDASAKYALTIKANHIGTYAPYMRYGFEAVWVDGNGNEAVVSTEIQFTLLTNPGARVVALAYAPEGNIFKSGENKNLTAQCDLWRGPLIDNENTEYCWGVRDEFVFKTVQMSAPVKAGSYTIPVRSIANMIPGGVIYIIGKERFVIQSVDEQAKTITLTTPTTREYVTNTIISNPFYDSRLGPGWAILSQDNQRGVTEGWTTNCITITPEAVQNFETFKCAIKDTDSSVGNSYAGQIVFDMITFTDMADPFTVDIVGTKGFIVKNGENDIDAKALLYRSGKEIDTLGDGCRYSWKLYDAEGSQVVSSYQGKQITISKADINIRGALMCEVFQGIDLIARGQVSVVELYDGEDVYSVQILTDNGSSFINGDIATTLTALVYKGSEEITDSIAGNLFFWKRISANPEGDAVWNELHAGIGRHLTISGEDVYRRATFTCEVMIN